MCLYRICPHGHAFTCWDGTGVGGGGGSQLSLPTPFSPICVCPFALRNLSSFFLFSHQDLPTYMRRFFAWTVHSVFADLSPVLQFCTSLVATSLFLCGLVEMRHYDRVQGLVSLEDGILVTEVTVGLRPLNANTSFWPGPSFRGRLSCFVCNFLSDRLFHLKIASTLSFYVQENGVPQGSILSPILF